VAAESFRHGLTPYFTPCPAAVWQERWLRAIRTLNFIRASEGGYSLRLRSRITKLWPTLQTRFNRFESRRFRRMIPGLDSVPELNGIRSFGTRIVAGRFGARSARRSTAALRLVSLFVSDQPESALRSTARLPIRASDRSVAKTSLTGRSTGTRRRARRFHPRGAAGPVNLNVRLWAILQN
jgi:hypothetical protein